MDVADAVTVFARDVLLASDRHAASRTRTQEIVMMFPPRAVTALRAVGLLARDGFTGDAWVVARVVLELEIDLAYILTDPERPARELNDAQPHAEKRNIENLTGILQRAARRTGESPGFAGSVDPEGSRIAEQKVHESEARRGKGNTPWRESLQQRAETGDRGSVYGWPYAIASAAAHTSIESLAYANDIDPTDGVTRWYIGGREPVAAPLIWANMSALMLVAEAATYCGLIDPFRTRYAGIAADVGKVLLKLGEKPRAT